MSKYYCPYCGCDFNKASKMKKHMKNKEKNIDQTESCCNYWYKPEDYIMNFMEDIDGIKRNEEEK